MRIHEYLEIDKEKKIRCIKCGHIFCNADQNYKSYALKAERLGSTIGSRMIQEGTFTRYHEFYCPGCLTMLEVDVLPPGHEPVWDIQIKV